MGGDGASEAGEMSEASEAGEARPNTDVHSLSLHWAHVIIR